VLHPSPQSPDLNPIDLWEQLDRNIRKMPIRTTPELKQRLIEEWNYITQKYLEKIISNMPKRLHKVIKQNGFPTY